MDADFALGICELAEPIATSADGNTEKAVGIHHFTLLKRRLEQVDAVPSHEGEERFPSVRVRQCEAPPGRGGRVRLESQFLKI